MTEPKKAPPITYGWWEKKRRDKWPEAVGDERNIALTPEEIVRYGELLKDAKALIDREFADVVYTVQVLQRERLSTWDNRMPKLFSLCSILEHNLAHRKVDLKLMELLRDIGARATERRKAREGSSGASKPDALAAPAVASGSGDQQPEGSAAPVPQADDGSTTPSV